MEGWLSKYNLAQENNVKNGGIIPKAKDGEVIKQREDFKGNLLNKFISKIVTPYGTGLGHPNYVLNNELFNSTYTDYKNKKINKDDIRKVIIDNAHRPNSNKKMKSNKSMRPIMPENINASKDALLLHQGLPQKYNSFSSSKYKPSMSKDIDKEYFALQGKAKQEIVDDLFKYQNSDFLSSNGTERKVKGSIAGQASLKNFKYSKGKDSKGEYVSYYDVNDYGNILDKVGKSFEIYDRIYVNKDKDGNYKPTHTTTQIENSPIDKTKLKSWEGGYTFEDGGKLTNFTTKKQPTWLDKY